MYHISIFPKTITLTIILLYATPEV